MLRFALLLASIAFLDASNSVAQESFSCPFGKQASCLDYGDKVCSSMGKCVDGNATCFQPNTCDYNGFMCVSDHNDYMKKAKTMAESYDDFRHCVATAADMNSVQNCIRADNLR